MRRDDDRADRLPRGDMDRANRPRVSVAPGETTADWLLPGALLAGLALALLFNTFSGLIPA